MAAFINPPGSEPLQYVSPLLTAPLKNIIPTHEYLLQGSILDSSRDILIHRLRGLCDACDSVPETFQDHEMVFSIKAVQAQASQPVVFRVRRALDDPDMPWHLRYLGQAEVGDKSRHTLIRSCLEVGCSHNVVQFLNEMGFRMDYEMVVKGYIFLKGRMKVTVSKVFRVLTPGNTNDLEPLTASYLVELSVVAPGAQDQIQEDMKSFAEQLKPLIQLEKIDTRRLQERP